MNGEQLHNLFRESCNKFNDKLSYCYNDLSPERKMIWNHLAISIQGDIMPLYEGRPEKETPATLNHVERAERELKAAKEIEKHQREQEEQNKAASEAAEARRELALKTLSEAAAGEITENVEARVEAAKALLN